MCLCVFLLPVGNLENMLLCVKLFLFWFLDDVNCKCTLCAWIIIIIFVILFQCDATLRACDSYIHKQIYIDYFLIYFYTYTFINKVIIITGKYSMKETSSHSTTWCKALLWMSGCVNYTRWTLPQRNILT